MQTTWIGACFRSGNKTPCSKSVALSTISALSRPL